MPWRWDRKKYPPNWEELSRKQRESTDFTCEFCGYRNGDLKENKRGEHYKVCVAAAHKWPNDESNPDPELYTLCQGDHRTYDNQFQDIIAEGKHQANMHEIALEKELKFYKDCAWCVGKCTGHYE